MGEDRKSTRLNSSHQSTRRLNSFPTRRSSDLNVVAALQPGKNILSSPMKDTDSTREMSLSVLHGRRSEEHTSELQSPIYTSIELFPYTTLFRSQRRSGPSAREEYSVLAHEGH